MAGGKISPLEEDDDNKSKSNTTQAFKLFSEFESPVEVAIALDLPFALHTLLRLHKIVKGQGMGEKEIINVFELAKHYLQAKVEYLRNEINMGESEKTKSTNYILNLNRMVDEFRETGNMYESSLYEKREEIANMNQELSHTDKLYPIKYSQSMLILLIQSCNCSTDS